MTGKVSRLPLPGRLQSTLSESSESLLNMMMPPAAIAHGEPPALSRGRSDLKSLKDMAASRSRSVSPTKPQAKGGKTPLSATSSQGTAESTKSSSTTSASKEMPSLQDIIDRMSKKGFASNSATNSKTLTSTNNDVNSTNAVAPVKKSTAEEVGTAKPAVSSTPKSQPSAQSKEQDVFKSKAESIKPVPSVEAKVEKGHPLQHKWTMYFDSKSWNPSTSTTSELHHPSSSTQANSWEAALKMLGVYTTVESFMSIFSTLRRPSQLERNSNYHLFKDGIKPMWEDAANQNGGKWIITLKGTNQALLDRSWMWLVLALIGEELDENDDITGAVVSTRNKGDRIALWIRNKTDVDLVNKIGKKFVLLLDLEKEPGVSLEFSPNSMDDGTNRKHSAPSKFISFNNAPAFGSPVFGQASLPPVHQTNRSQASPVKSVINNNHHSRLGPSRRGSEQMGESGNSQFPMGLGGPIGRTNSPGPSKTGGSLHGSLSNSNIHSSFINHTNNSIGLQARHKMGLGMSPPM